MDPNGIRLEFATYARALGPQDIGVAPLDAAGRPVTAKEATPA
jgi:hypothetical protein